METVLDARAILARLPHRFPFLLVDRVLTRETGTDPKSRAGQKITALKNVTFNEPFFTGHFPEMPIMPGVLQIEAMAQAACLAYLRDGDAEFDFFIASIQEARFRKPVVPGDSLILQAEILKDRSSMLQIRTEALVDGKVVAEATIMAKASPKTNRETVQ